LCVDFEMEVSAVTRRCIGLDLHRDFAQAAVWQDGLVRPAGQIAMTVDALGVFADSLAPADEVAVAATGNTNAIVPALRGRVARVVVANPQKTRAIAEAKVKTDKSSRDPRAVAGRGLPAGGVGGRRANAGAPSPGR
jgi:hypothetical protein